MDATVFVGIDVSKQHLDVHLRPLGRPSASGATVRASRPSPSGWRPTPRPRLRSRQQAASKPSSPQASPRRACPLSWSIRRRCALSPMPSASGPRPTRSTPPSSPISSRPPGPPSGPCPTRRRSCSPTSSPMRRQIDGDDRCRAAAPGRAPARVARSIQRLITALEKELASLDRDIDDAVRGSPAWRDKEDLLASVPGIGKTIARTLIAELPELGSLDRREVAALAGLAPFTRQSGQWRGKGFIAGGRARAAVFMGAMVAARHNPTLKAFRDRLVAARRRSSPSSPPPESCSPFSTPSSGINGRSALKALDPQDDRSPHQRPVGL